MRRNAEKCDRICRDVQRYANFRTCGIISAYAILKTQLYVEKYAICMRIFAKYAIEYAIAYAIAYCSHKRHP